MKDLVITTKAPKVNKEATVTLQQPETAAEAIQVFGDEVVRSNAVRNWVVTAQATVRRGLEKGLSEAELQAKMKDAKMGLATLIGGGIVDPLQAALAKAATMNAEELAAYIKQLKQAAAGQPAQAAAA
jgi:hypothetical protein